MRIIITEKNVGDLAALHIIKKIIEFQPNPYKKFVLGLPTGGTILGMYKKLIEFHKKGLVSFENVITFNMDEYVGLDKNHSQSYHYYMWENFFKHIDIKKENINILNGMATDHEEECRKFEEKIKEVGGINLFIGGIGANGHIAFNEPGSSLNSRTRKVKLAQDTIKNNSRFFENDIDKVPKYALTVGVGTITDAREVLILANGSTKATAIQQVVEGGISSFWTITALQLHQNAIIIADEEASSELKVRTYKYHKDIESENLDTDKLIKEFLEIHQKNS